MAAITDAPVCPALKSAAACPSRTASAATRIDALGLRRNAAAAGSAISIRSGASTTSTSRPPRRWMARELGINRRRIAHEQQPDLQMARCHERAVDDRCRSRVVPHGVDGNAHRQMSGLGVQPSA